VDDLASLDPKLYRCLLAVKNFDGNVEDLSLNFTRTHLENGQSVNADLIPNGSNTPVTNQNRIHYIYAVAHYRLNVQIAKQCRAFFCGLSTIVNIKWLRMFNQQELQIVLSGASVPIGFMDDVYMQ
jgi:ubiquitin-protein ligase E3 C